MSRPNALILILGGSLLCAIVAVPVAYQAELRPLRAQVLAGSQMAQTAAGPIEYAIVGTGVPLLSIHGASGGYDQGLMIASALVGDSFRTIAPSRFGYLRTPLPADPSAAAQAEAHAALLDALRVDRVIVLGVSAGAPSAVQLAIRHPDRVAALILLSPLGYAPDSQTPLPGGKTINWLTRSGVDFVYWTMLHLSPSTLTPFLGVPPRLMEKAGPDDQRWVSHLLHSGLPLSLRVAGVTNDLSVRLLLRSDRWPLERIAAPTLIVASSDDLFHTQPAAEYAAAHIPAAMLVVYPTGGHLFIGHTADLRRSVAFFLRQALRAQPMSTSSRDPSLQPLRPPASTHPHS